MQFFVTDFYIGRHDSAVHAGKPLALAKRFYYKSNNIRTFI